MLKMEEKLLKKLKQEEKKEKKMTRSYNNYR